ncbi:MAG: hypothetical protein DRG78_20200 [Epsilonproteobacteria bacterium]|nr:MAG: hypothetical protein DRG78_20200 [Campylobacterota bacterium]
MKTFDFNAMFLLLVVVMFLVVLQARADTTNIKMAWDFRSSQWRIIEFIGGKHATIKVYTTAEDVTDLVQCRLADGKNIFIIKERKCLEN